MGRTAQAVGWSGAAYPRIDLFCNSSGYPLRSRGVLDPRLEPLGHRWAYRHPVDRLDGGLLPRVAQREAQDHRWAVVMSATVFLARPARDESEAFTRRSHTRIGIST